MDKNSVFITEAKDFLLNLLPRAGQLARRYFHTEELPSHSKGELDFATTADLKVNEFLIKNLTEKYPNIPVLSEESSSKIEFDENTSLLWIVDPLDGTANFARGDVNFSVSVALVEKGNPLVGVIFAPISSRLFWTTILDNHSFWNGRTIEVSKIEKLEESIVCTDWSHILSTRDMTTRFLRKIYGRVRQIKILGSAATDITLLARGGVDVYHHVRLFPWDVAAAGLIAQKAGAKVTQIDGKPWNSFSESILTANSKLHAKVLTL